MVQCELCGAETASPRTAKIEGAELEVCDDCADLGTEVKTEESTSTSTKYSTDSSGSSSSSSASSSGSSTGGSGGGGRRRDMFDEMDELVPDYGERIRSAREERGLSQEDLGDQINEKASLIRKLERSDTLPSDGVQRKLEGHLNITLTESGGGEDDDEYSTTLADEGLTLGDKVERRDS